MAYGIKHLTPQDIATAKEKHPLASPKEWALMDGNMVYGYYVHSEQAQAELDQFKVDERIEEKFQEWMNEIMLIYKVDYTHLAKLIESQF